MAQQDGDGGSILDSGVKDPWCYVLRRDIVFLAAQMISTTGNVFPKAPKHCMTSGASHTDCFPAASSDRIFTSSVLVALVVNLALWGKPVRWAQIVADDVMLVRTPNQVQLHH